MSAAVAAAMERWNLGIGRIERAVFAVARGRSGRAARADSAGLVGHEFGQERSSSSSGSAGRPLASAPSIGHGLAGFCGGLRRAGCVYRNNDGGGDGDASGGGLRND